MKRKRSKLLGMMIGLPVVVFLVALFSPELAEPLFSRNASISAVSILKSLFVGSILVGALLALEETASFEGPKWARMTKFVTDILGAALLFGLITASYEALWSVWLPLEAVLMHVKETVVFGVMVVSVAFILLRSCAVMFDSRVSQAAVDESRRIESERRLARTEHLPHAVVLILFVLSMFAFGLTSEKGEDGVVIVRVLWREVPAILIVVILVELGLTLVQQVNRVRGSLDKTVYHVDQMKEAVETVIKKAAATTKKAKEISGAVRSTQESLEGVSEELSSRIDQLQVVDLLGPLTEFCSRTNMAKKATVDALAEFLKSWLPNSPMSTRAALTGAFFLRFIGTSPGHGSVRHLPKCGSVACITADAVFVDVSKERLNIAGSIEADADCPGVTVRATTSLFPTEFILSSLWRPVGAAADNHRGGSLGAFVDTVRSTCESDYIQRYSRISVFKVSEHESSLVSDQSRGMRNVFLGKKLSDRHNMNATDIDYCLDHWFILDDTSVDGSDKIRRAWIEDTIATCKSLGYKLPFQACHPDNPLGDIQKVMVKCAPGGRTRYRKYVRSCGDAHLLPVMHPDSSDDGCFFMFSRSAGECLSDGSDAVARPIGLLGLRPKWSNGEFTLDTTLVDALNGCGWRSLRRWYVTMLHVDNGHNAPGALWAEEDTIADVTKELAFSWGDHSWSPLDLLLVEEKRNGASLYTGLVSNLQLARPECTIRIIDGLPLACKLAEILNKAEKDIVSGAKLRCGDWSSPLTRAIAIGLDPHANQKQHDDFLSERGLRSKSSAKSTRLKSSEIRPSDKDPTKSL